MNPMARQIITAAIRAARAVDPAGVTDFDDALATVSGRPRRGEKPETLLLTQAETARLYGVSRWTIRELRATGKLNPVELRPGVFRYRKREVLALAGEVEK